MSEVKRYESGVYYCSGVAMVESSDGDYVSFSDYAALKAERDALVAKVKQLEWDSVFIPKNLDQALTVMGVSLPVSKEEFNFQINRWIQRLVDRVIRNEPDFSAYANQLRAEAGAKALEDFADFNMKSIDLNSDEYTEVLIEVSRAARGFAANLRKENGHD